MIPRACIYFVEVQVRGCAKVQENAYRICKLLPTFLRHLLRPSVAALVDQSRRAPAPGGHLAI